MAEVGEWIGQHVLGPVGVARAERAPSTALVEVPLGAEVLAYRH